MVALLRLLAELLLVILPLAGMIVAAFKAFSANRRRPAPEPAVSKDADTAPLGVPRDRPAKNLAARWTAIRRVVEEHSRTDARWLEYELDLSKLLDFPLMTDMRAELTMSFHKAKLRADFLRPAKAEDLLDDPEAADRYLAAVGDYVGAFNAAETEAIRRRRSDFSHEEQQRIGRAQRLFRVVSDAGATPQERQHAYDRAHKELEGLIVLPARAQAQLERAISGEIDG